MSTSPCTEAHKSSLKTTKEKKKNLVNHTYTERTFNSWPSVWCHVSFEEEKKGLWYLSDLEGTLAVVTSEAGLVIDLAVSSELIHQVDCLLACSALLGSPSK